MQDKIVEIIVAVVVIVVVVVTLVHVVVVVGVTVVVFGVLPLPPQPERQQTISSSFYVGGREKKIQRKEMTQSNTYFVVCFFGYGGGWM